MAASRLTWTAVVVALTAGCSREPVVLRCDFGNNLQDVYSIDERAGSVRLMSVQPPRLGKLTATDAAYRLDFPENHPKQGYLLLQVDIREPNPQTGDPGVINLWVRPLKVIKKKGPSFLQYDPKSEPRAYRLPYSRKMHEDAERARGMIKNGKPVIISKRGLKGGEGDGDGDGEGDGDGRPGGRGQPGAGGRRVDDPQFDIYEMPPGHLAPKTPEDNQ